MRFALGPWRRCVDWFDWMLPEAWNIEHNHRHHYNLGEDSDPDQLEMNMYDLRPGGPLGGLPNVVKRVLVAIIATLWKWWYYAPNTYKHLIRARAKKAKDDVNFDRANTNLVWTLFAYMLPGHWHFLAQLFGEVLLPFAVYKFGVYPLPFLLLGKAAYLNALRCVLCAEMLSNVYAFVIIGPNHSGDDMYCYDTHVEPYSGGFYLRAILSSANFDAGTDTIDFLHGFLNYQVEHHCFPSLTALSYRKAMPRVKAICAKHGIPYTQQNVFKRVLKTVEIMIGSQSLRRFPKAAVKAE
jgi:fatty acid desaturase